MTQGSGEREGDRQAGKRIRFLAGFDVFKELDETALSRLAALCRERPCAGEEVVFRQRQPADALYLIRQGTVALYRDEVGRPLQLFARYLQGDYFGELGIFEGGERQATARAREPTLLLRIDRNDLLEFLEDHPQTSLKLQMAAARHHSEKVAAMLGIGPRDDVRIRLRQQVVMRLPDGGRRPVVLENLSIGGLSLRGTPAGWVPPLRVCFSLDLAGEPLDVRGRVCWRGNDALGLAFVDKSADHDERVERAMRRLLHRT